MDNRIREIRHQKGLKLEELASLIGVSRATVANYENGSTEPKLETWQKLSDALGVPVPYLQGISNDLDGWSEWEKNTGYSRNSIESEIERLTLSGHIKSDMGLQTKIGLAVSALDGTGETDRAILRDMSFAINRLRSDLDNRYQDPEKVTRYHVGSINNVVRIPTNTSTTDLIYSDLSPEAYERARKILQNARDAIEDIANDLGLN